ncbi:MAG: glycoside hydrolase family 2 [Pirellulaceae bacterium]|nr:glycoside hydrolase family 2 [Pirellulaceae bacterium]
MAALSLMATDRCHAQEIIDQWRYTVGEPADGWQQTGFDDQSWQEASGGFGTRGTPGARIGTTWDTDDIWLRKTFHLDSIPKNPALWMHHDEDAQIYINGELVAETTGYISGYELKPIAVELRGAIRTGNNVMAVHCHQSTGGQFIDVHFVDADNVPKLPPAKRNTKPFQSDLITSWGADVTPENVWTEYPRPQLVRPQWQNLNGQWDYAITPKQQTTPPREWAGKILVPFCPESRLSGVKRLLNGDEAFWYARTFEISNAGANRTLLNFEAVDYQCEIFVNGQAIGSNRGGHTPFSLDISEALDDGTNTLVVRVEDETEGWQLRGKQVLDAHGIWYTQVSGIWQTVWLETVPDTYIEELKITTDVEAGTITVKSIVSGESSGIAVVVRDGDDVVVEVSGEGDTVTAEVPNAKLWSPSTPHLYDLDVAVLQESGEAIDEVTSYTGIRSVGKVKDSDGHWRFTLNGEPIFHWGPLDQGWWPDGLLTPPSDEAMLFDIQWLKDAGFNMIRKHIKVEPRRYYYHCDRLGMMVWQDQVSAGNNPKWTRLQPNPQDANWPEQHHQQFMVELERMISALENHPCITVWVPFNEAWGQHRTVDVGNWTVKRDPTRLVNVASGGNFWPAGDIVDHHQYPHPGFPFDLDVDGRFGDYIKVIGEFGGHGYPVKGHLWDANRRNWGYGGLPKTEAEYKERYATSLRMLNEFRDKGIAGGVYTQTTDVEGEINGLMTYDRKVIKIPAKELAEMHQVLFE